MKTLMAALDVGGAAGKTPDFCCFCPCLSATRATIVSRETQEPISLQNLKAQTLRAIEGGEELREFLLAFEPLKWAVGRQVLSIFVFRLIELNSSIGQMN